MRRLLIYALLALLVAIGLVTLIEKDPGYVLISYGLTTVEMSVWVALFLLVLAVFLVQFMLAVYRRLTMPGGAIGRWFSSHSRNRAQRLTTTGLINFIEGNWLRAKRMHLRAARRSDTPLINFLIAARASNELGDARSMQVYLREAERSEAGAGIAVELTQAELQLSNGQLEEALATLVRARKNAGKHPYVLRLLMQVYHGLKDWRSLQKLMPELKKYKVVSVEKLAELEAEVYTNILQAVAGDASTSEQALTALKNAWKEIPSREKQSPELAECYVRRLHQSGGDVQAEKFLSAYLQKHWYDGLVQLYGLLEGEDLHRQLIIAQVWLKDRPNNAVLLLCLGRLCLRNELWGKAREYFEASFKLEKKPETCAELGRLLANLKETELSNHYFQEGLMLSERGLPQLPQPIKHTV